MKPPHVAAQRVLVPEHLETELARDVARLVAMHVTNVAREGVPGQLLIAVRASFLLARGTARTRWAALTRG